jgi:hypothetical protein
MTTHTREQLTEMLHSSECVIEFTKVGGEVRTMSCTLKSEMFTPPVAIEPETPKREKKANPDVLSVWCLDKKEWRSFRIANVISAKAKE